MSRTFARAGTLGEGSFGRVERVVDTESGELFAAKVFFTDKDDYPATETLVELQFLHCLGKHPNIVALERVIFDLDGLHGVPVAILGLCQKDLGKCISWLSKSQRTQALRDLWRALAYLHGPPTFAILHRDIKTGNVLLDFSEAPASKIQARLCDFSFAAWFPKDSPLTSFTDLKLQAPDEGPLGTTGYIAPELFEDLPYTTAADVWAGAVVSLEVLQGKSLECARDKAAFREIFATRDRLGKGVWASLLRQLLQEEPDYRLSAENTLNEIEAICKDSTCGSSELAPEMQQNMRQNISPAGPENALQEGLRFWKAEISQHRKQKFSKAFALLQAPPAAEAYVGLFMQRFPEASPLTVLILVIQLLMGESVPDPSSLRALAVVLQCDIPSPQRLLNILESCQGDLLGVDKS